MNQSGGRKTARAGAKSHTPFFPGGSARSRPPLFLLLAPLVLVLYIGGARFAQHYRNEDSEANRAARALVGQELSHLRQHVDAENLAAASRSAQTYVRADLLPAVNLNDGIEQISVTRLQPHRYQVRGTVHWYANGLQKRRFETDLQLGPADDKWRLVDTEFLP